MLGTTTQIVSKLLTSPLIKTLSVHVFVFRLSFHQNNQIKNPSYLTFFFQSFYFLASLSKINILVAISRMPVTLLGQRTTAPLFSLQQLAY